MLLYKHGSALIDGKIIVTDIVANHGRIIAIEPDVVPDNDTEVIDCNGKFILPALVDIHTHGANGYDFNTADKDGMKKILDFYISHGVGTVLPTVMTDSDDVICRQVALIAELSKDYPEIKGIHLEGPFLSADYCGAHDKQYLQTPSFDKFLTYQKSAQGLIKLVTVAPELPHAIDFITEATTARVKVSLGHSGANHDTVEKALKAGAVSFTHFGNSMSQMDRRDLNMVGSALSSNAYAEVICDGKHVDKDVLAFLVRSKGINKVIGVTDSFSATGCNDGNYKLGALNVTVKDGQAYLDGTNKTVGSMLDAHTGLANVISFTGLKLPEAIKLWTINPAKMLGLDNRIGTIEVGKDADFIVIG
ncbi:MAG: N-acetylglucosamine-6-phosphate deacetylase [Clostridia bacterium]|nr:N-acetylglucosamine-6-phosphate deacetylase [Clostridia bacterium]